MEYSRTIEMLDSPGVYGVRPHSSNDPSPPTEHRGLRAAQACVACRKQKRKCDKQLPLCSLCSRMGRSCDYSDSTPTPNADDFAMLRQKVTDLEAKLESRDTPWGRTNVIGGGRSYISSPDQSLPPEQSSSFPPMFLLDSEIFKETRMIIPKPAIKLGPEVYNTLGSIIDVRDIVDRYFENVHLWLPIVSKKRTQLTLEKPAPDIPADLALLLLAMKLIGQGGHQNPIEAQSPLYWMAKHCFSLVESGGLMTVQFLQSALLITAYEIGNAIYPAAYLSSGHCTRIGILMGIHDRHHAPQILRKSGAWSEVEEIKRCWWAAMLFDRYVHLGSEGHQLATDDPPLQTVLPANESSWDEGDMTTSEPLYMSTPTSVRAGAFARTCQATHLMGRMIRVLNDRSSDPATRFAEAIQLHRTLTALSNVLPYEVSESAAQYSTAMGLCYSSLLHLCEPFSCTETNRGDHTLEETEMQAISIPGMQEAAGKVLEFSLVLQKLMDQNLSAISPLLADCLYSATATFQWLVHETGSEEYITGYNSLRSILVEMSKRWVVAGEYVKILEVRLEYILQSHR
ncbi:uncharacterized protein HMPREF1541_07186 [Cyphellophora europaea CBS 101466]|uniref:Zn(2)-C6 fungal-type domain-containing protein n=1 Tax=Cyphellophora europaea (strain CBS 101466) TaxID=1220924 RepID=W2RPB4_CYPE1|nr:uncharacterized protein HMPREF1541_07186 [Cyphellophora europaea CBS 101466]ETN37564.1 hypothetical protein HMPREF1541_07186 [Cyphellophora europaea CBS 101466]